MQARVGLELEFMVASQRPGDRSWPKELIKSDKRWPTGAKKEDLSDDSNFANNGCVKAVCHAIASLGVPVCRTIDAEPMPGDPNETEGGFDDAVPVEGGCKLLVWNLQEGLPKNLNSKQLRFKYWHVGDERSATKCVHIGCVVTEGRYRWSYAIEINSPIISDQEELDGGLPTLKKILVGIRNQIQTWLNSECGFHIHVSPLSMGLSLHVAKRMAALVLLMEQRFLLSLCHPARRKSAYCKPAIEFSVMATGALIESVPSEKICDEINLLQAFRSAAQGRSTTEDWIFKTLVRVFKQKDIQSLSMELTLPPFTQDGAQGDRCGIALSMIGTVELRYPEASVDVDFLSLWVDLSRRILALAGSSDKEYGAKLVKFYDLATAANEADLLLWLRELGLEERADFCKERIRRYFGDLKNLDELAMIPKVKASRNASNCK